MFILKSQDNFDDFVIEQIERFARSDLQELIEKDEYEEYYGVYHKQP